MLHNQLKTMSNYNVWANTKIKNMIFAAGEIKADVQTGGSYGTIRKTAYHIFDAETVWFYRLNNRTIEYWPPSRDFSFSLEHFCALFIERSVQLSEYVKQQTEFTLNTNCVYKTTKGLQHETPVKMVLTHVFNHSTYHRGQIIQMLRMLNAPLIKATDFIEYWREQKS